jgi:hypothetical protein
MLLSELIWPPVLEELMAIICPKTVQPRQISKKEEIRAFLDEKVFNLIRNSSVASNNAGSP